MKRTIKTLALIVVSVSALVTFSCQKKELKNEPIVNGKATIKGKALADLDMTNDTAGVINEKVPQGTMIYAKINSAQLVENPSNSLYYGDIYYSTKVDAQGNFTFTIDANNNPVDVEFSSDDFEANQIQPDTTVKPMIFTLPLGFQETVHDSVTKYVDLYFDVK